MALSFRTRNDIPGLTLNNVDENTSAGTGSLVAASDDTVTWSAPDGSAGSAVTIANGETKLVYDGTTTTLYIVVSRTSATALDGTAIVIITTGVSTSERLAQVDDAITECLRAQSTEFGEDKVQLAALKELRAYRTELAQELAAENNTHGRTASLDLSGGV